jgi:predicted ATPase
MLGSVTYRDFKRYQNTTLSLSSPITVLVGPNSSGKSSLLKGILAFKQTYEDPSDHAGFMSHGQYVDIGLFSEYVRDHDVKNTASFTFEIANFGHNPFRSAEPIKFNTAFVTIEQSEDPQTKHGRVDLYTVHLFQDFEGEASHEDTKYFIQYRRMQKSEERFRISVSRELYNLLASARLSPQQKQNVQSDDMYNRAMQKCASGQVQAQRDNKRGMTIDFSKSIFDESIEVLYRIERLFVERAHGLLVAALTSDLFALAALRSKPSRSFKRTDERRTVGSEGQNTASVFSDLRERSIKSGVRRGRSREDFDRLEDWFRRLKLGERLDIGSYRDLLDMRMQSKKHGGIGESVVDIGVGFSQAAPILVQLAAMPDESVLILEQPELHLYPWTQTRLGQILCEEAKLHGKRLLIETHSEHLIHGMQLHVSETRKKSGAGLLSSDISIIYVDKDAGLTALNMDEYGEFTEPWPDGFFDQTISVYRKIIENKLS